MEQRDVRAIGDPDPRRRHASTTMPYGWISPRMGGRGWAGVALLGVFVGLLQYIDPPWPVLILGWFAIWMVPMELIRTDAIQQYGAIMFEHVASKDPDLAEDLYWRDDRA